MTPLQIYWLITIPKIGDVVGTFLLILGIVGSVTLPFLFIMQAADQIFSWKQVKPYFIASVIMTMVGGLMIIFIPSSKEIVAIYGISYVSNNKDLREIPPKLFEYANIKLDEVLQETK
jgi:glycerol uptake facilitator-like aquaporin